VNARALSPSREGAATVRRMREGDEPAVLALLQAAWALSLGDLEMI
jgi:hypothetical protein